MWLRSARRKCSHSPVVNGDETGWREDGQNGYVWAVLNAGQGRCATTSMITAAAIGWRSASSARTRKGYLGSDFYAG